MFCISMLVFSKFSKKLLPLEPKPLSWKSWGQNLMYFGSNLDKFWALWSYMFQARGFPGPTPPPGYAPPTGTPHPGVVFWMVLKPLGISTDCLWISKDFCWFPMISIDFLLSFIDFYRFSIDFSFDFYAFSIDFSVISNDFLEIFIDFCWFSIDFYWLLLIISIEFL